MKKEQPKRKPGRPPKQKTVERRIEQALIGKREVEEKRGPGRPRLDYSELQEHIRFIIDAFAVGYGPTRVIGLLKEKYGELDERVLGMSTLISYRKKYFDRIQKREVELREELPIILPSMRIRYLQRVIDEAEAGVPIVSKSGEVYLKKDSTAIINAVKEMNAMQKDLDQQRQATSAEISEQRQIEEQKVAIREYVAERMAETGQSALEVLKSMSETLNKDYPEAVEQLASEYSM